MPYRFLWAAVAILITSFGAVRAQEAREAPFEKEIRAFEEADKRQAPPRGAVLFVGSSSIRMWKTLEKDFPKLTVVNRGFGGSTIRDSIRYADRIVIPYQPERIVLYAGDNDIAQGKTAEQVFADFKEFVAMVRGKLPGVPIDFIAIKPSIKRWGMVETMREANRLIREYARAEEGLGYIDIFTPMLGADGMPRKALFVDDGLHLNDEGYRLWTKVVAGYLEVEGKPRSSSR